MTLAIAVLGLALLLFALLRMWTRHQRQALGLERGSIVAPMTLDWGCPPSAPIASA